MKTSHNILFAIYCAIGALLIGCNDTRRLESPPVPTDPTRIFVEQMLPVFDRELHEHVETMATRRAIRALLEAESKRPWGRRIKGGIKYADLFERLYKERRYRKAFARSDGLRERGHRVLEVIAASDAHALSPAPYHVARIQQLDAKIAKAASANQWAPFLLTGPEAERLVEFIRAEKIDPADGQARTRVFTALLEPNSPIPRVWKHATKFREQFAATAADTAQLELRVADGALRYARDMKHFNLNRMDWREIRDAGGGKAVIYKKLATTFQEIVETPAQNQKSIFDALEPPHPQYRRLIKALASYRAVATNGGWSKISKVPLQMETSGARVKALATRLATEGYLALAPNTGAAASDPMASQPDIQGRVDQPLIDAVHAYQETHQLKVTDEPTRGFWRSLNIPVERRIEQITTSIERWRESRYRNEPDFIFVNIPDFYAEVYQGHERKLRFRVVVGNNKRKCDPKTNTWIYPNATPIQMARLDHLIVNPHWNVPKRIEDEEIRPAMERDPKYLVKNDYELIGKGEHQRIRQKPGPKNALGTVKFIFPNRHNTYMHDSPKKRFFNYPIRAFSHGCVRVSEPTALAEHLLEKESIMTAEDLSSLIASNRTKKFELANKMPVFFEYYVTRVDDQGRTHFLSDIYRLDQKLDTNEQVQAASCKPKGRMQPHNKDEEIIAPAAKVLDVGP